MNGCPHCQALKDRIQELEEVLGDKEILWKDYVLKLGITPTQARILSIIICRKVASRDQLMAVLYGYAKEDRISNNISVHMSRLRKALKANQITIDSEYYIGYSMTNENKQKLKKLMETIDVR